MGASFWRHFGAILVGWEHPFGVILGGLGGSGAPPGSWALSDPLQGGSGAPLAALEVHLGTQDDTLGALSCASAGFRIGP